MNSTYLDVNNISLLLMDKIKLELWNTYNNITWYYRFLDIRKLKIDSFKLKNVITLLDINEKPILTFEMYL